MLILMIMLELGDVVDYYLDPGTFRTTLYFCKMGEMSYLAEVCALRVLF